MSDLSPQLYYYRNPSHDPEYNLRLEDHLLSSFRSGRFLMLWQNDSSVILGRNQIAVEEVDLACADREKIRILHRSTGGGAVYHDPGNINYTWIDDFQTDGSCSLRSLAEPILAALREMGLSAEFSGRNDILVDGRKICGTAARIDGNRILSHGCLCFSVNLDRMNRVLTPSREKLERHGIASVRSRVASISEFLPQMNTSQFLNRLEEILLRGCSVQRLEEVYPDLLSEF